MPDEPRQSDDNLQYILQSIFRQVTAKSIQTGNISQTNNLFLSSGTSQRLNYRSDIADIISYYSKVTG
jgi:hypothetical protein